MAAAGLRPEADLVVESDFTYAGGKDVSRQLLDKAPTALFAANDQMALGALAAARSAGVEVPSQLTVVGFGDTTPARQAVPGLTTMSMPHHRLGAEAMEAVLDALELGSTQVYPRRLPHHLVVRESSTTAPK